MFGFNLQDVLKLGGTVASIRAVHEGFGCLQQVSKTRKPDRTETPKALFREPGDGLKSIVFTPVRIAAQVLQIAQFAKYRAPRRVSQDLPQLIESDDFMPIKELFESLHIIYWRFHNDILALTEAIVKPNILIMKKPLMLYN